MATKNTIILWKDMHEIADLVCKYFGLSYGKIVPETRMRKQDYGECWPCDRCCKAKYIEEANCKEKILYIRIHQLNKPRQPLATKTIMDTLAHELGHLKEWDHGKKHAEFQDQIKDYIKELRPGVL